MNNAENPVSPPGLPPIIATVVPEPIPPRLPWGGWATLGLGMAMLAVYIFAQSAATIGVMAIHAIRQGGKISEQFETVALDGDVLGLAILLGAPLAIFFAGWLIKLRQGPTLAVYLGWHWPKWRSVIRWSLGMAAVIVGSELLTGWLNRPDVPEVMLAIYRTADFKPLLWLGIVLLGPAAEEVIFRGFLFHGWQQSRLGNWGTILLTALLWAGIHLQYDAYGIATIFTYGIFLGLIRWQTGSMLLCVVLHSVLNLVATIQVEQYLATA